MDAFDGVYSAEMQNGEGAMEMSDGEESNEESRLQSMTEKGIRNLCLELVELKNAAAEELTRNVYSNHTAFVRISQEVTDLEGEIMELKMHISEHGNLIRDLMDGIYVEFVSSQTWTDMSLESVYLDHGAPPSELKHRIYYLSEALGVLLSEHKEDEALSILEAEEKTLTVVQKNKNNPSSVLALYESTISEWKARVAEQFVQTAKQSRVCGSELKKVLSGLCRLGDGSHAHTLLLNSHHLRLQTKIQNMFHPTGSYCTNYMTMLTRLVFSTISLAIKDSVTIFGETSAYTSELVLWARKETENFVQLVKKNVLFLKERPGGFQTAVQCVQVAVGHCNLLEAQGIVLRPYLLKLIQPCMEELVTVYLKQVEISINIVAANDDWLLTSSTGINHIKDEHSIFLRDSGNLANQVKLTSSAKTLIAMVQGIAEDLAPIINLHVGQSIVGCIVILFNKYIDILITAMPCSSEDENNTGFRINPKLIPAKTEAQQLALLANATAIAGVFLPQVVSNISIRKGGNLVDSSEGDHKILRRNTSHIEECKDWMYHIQCSVDKLRDHFCRQYVLDVIYSNEGDPHLAAHMYLNDMDENLFSGRNLMPSSPFQEWFVKLTWLGQVSSDMLFGRDRAASQLLMRLTETFVTWLFNDQEFWDTMEHNSPPLSSSGLQQFVLDMHFLVKSAICGHYSSRNMEQMVSIMTRRAVSAFSAATAKDHRSSLPTDAWFSETAQEAINKLQTQQAQIILEGDDPKFEEKSDDHDDKEPGEKLRCNDHDKVDGESNLELVEEPDTHDHESMLHHEPDSTADSCTSLESSDSE